MWNKKWSYSSRTAISQGEQSKRKGKRRNRYFDYPVLFFTASRTSDHAKVKSVFKMLTTKWKTFTNEQILARI